MDQSSGTDLKANVIRDSNAPVPDYSVCNTDDYMILVDQLPGMDLPDPSELQFMTGGSSKDVSDIEDNNDQGSTSEMDTSDFTQALIHIPEMEPTSNNVSDLGAVGINELLNPVPSFSEQATSIKSSRSQKTVLSPKGKPIREKTWPLHKTKLLLKLIKKHQQKFKKAQITRKLIWSEISKEMRLGGFTECDRDECGKKWDNLFRSYKTVFKRDGKSATWDLYAPVKELVKLLNWPRPVTGSRKVTMQTIDEPLDVSRVIDSMQKHSENRRNLSTLLYSRINDLNEERDTILRRMDKFFKPLQKDGSLKDLVDHALMQDSDNEREQLVVAPNSNIEGIPIYSQFEEVPPESNNLEDIAEACQISYIPMDEPCNGDNGSNSDLAAPFQISYETQQLSTAPDMITPPDSIYLLHLSADKTEEGEAVYKFIQLNGFPMETSTENDISEIS